MSKKPNFVPNEHFVTAVYLAIGVSQYECPEGKSVQEYLETGQLEMIDSLEPYGKVLDEVFNELCIDGFPGVPAYEIAEDRIAQKLGDYVAKENSLPDLDEFQQWSYQVTREWREEKDRACKRIA